MKAKLIYENDFKTRLECKLMFPRFSVIAAFLLDESKNEFSKYKNYLDILPKSFDNIPICFIEQELDLVKGSSFHLEIKQRQEQLLFDYNLICE